MSFEAIANVRPVGFKRPFAAKWMTVPTDDIGAASRAFQALGYEVKGLRIIPQEEATRIAALM